ncbi:hypothetical protein JB92DRAFT_2834842 [Gautieria morchelliformis]|nr:hypothetical protein JB92DRAFT_2834842 [Gautieria morchelliformis]
MMGYERSRSTTPLDPDLAAQSFTVSFISHRADIMSYVVFPLLHDGFDSPGYYNYSELVDAMSGYRAPAPPELRPVHATVEQERAAAHENNERLSIATRRADDDSAGWDSRAHCEGMAAAVSTTQLPTRHYCIVIIPTLVFLATYPGRSSLKKQRACPTSAQCSQHLDNIPPCSPTPRIQLHSPPHVMASDAAHSHYPFLVDKDSKLASNGTLFKNPRMQPV